MTNTKIAVSKQKLVWRGSGDKKKRAASVIKKYNKYYCIKGMVHMITMLTSIVPIDNGE